MLAVANATVGSVASEQDGTFSATVTVPELTVGRYDIVATCGPVLRSPIDVVVVSQVDAGTSTLGLFLFFVLLSLVLFRRRRPPPAPERTVGDT